MKGGQTLFIGKNSMGELINLLSFERKELMTFSSEKWYCPACGSKLLLKVGKKMRAHFSHRRNSHCLSYSEVESAEHLRGKEILANWCEKGGFSFQLEAFLPELSQRPDLLLANKIVIEFQCSPISLTKYLERTTNYLKHGYRVIWILGQNLWLKSKLSQLQRGMLNHSGNLGYHLWQLDSVEEKLSCIYHLEELVIKKNIFFSKKDLLDHSSVIDYLSKSADSAGVLESRVYQTRKLLKKIRYRIDYALLKREVTVLGLQEKLYLEGTNLRRLSDDFLLPVTSFLFAKDSIIIWRFYLWKCCQKLEGQSVKAITTYFKSFIQVKDLKRHRLPLINFECMTDIFVSQTLANFVKVGRIKITGDKVYLLKLSSAQMEGQSLTTTIRESQYSPYHISTIPDEDMVR